MSSQAHLRKAGRSASSGVKLIQKTGGNLVLASGVTISLLFGMVLALSLAAVFIINSPDPVVGLSIALPITLIFNIAAFFPITLLDGLNPKLAVQYPLGFPSRN